MDNKHLTCLQWETRVSVTSDLFYLVFSLYTKMTQGYWTSFWKLTIKKLCLALAEASNLNEISYWQRGFYHIVEIRNYLTKPWENDTGLHAKPESRTAIQAQMEQHGNGTERDWRSETWGLHIAHSFLCAHVNKPFLRKRRERRMACHKHT